MKPLLVIFLVSVLYGCEGPEYEFTEQVQQEQGRSYIPVVDSDRVEVTRLSVFGDTLAYEGKRGVYLIKDKETGAEFIGVSGVGISEIGSHSRLVGKATVRREDER